MLYWEWKLRVTKSESLPLGSPCHYLEVKIAKLIETFENIHPSL